MTGEVEVKAGAEAKGRTEVEDTGMGRGVLTIFPVIATRVADEIDVTGTRLGALLCPSLAPSWLELRYAYGAVPLVVKFLPLLKASIAGGLEHEGHTWTVGGAVCEDNFRRVGGNQIALACHDHDFVGEFDEGRM